MSTNTKKKASRYLSQEEFLLSKVPQAPESIGRTKLLQQINRRILAAELNTLEEKLVEEDKLFTTSEPTIRRKSVAFTKYYAKP